MPSAYAERVAVAFDTEVAELGVRSNDLPDDPVALGRRLAVRVAAPLRWEHHLGPLLPAGAVLALTGWTKQNLSQAVRAHRVLRLTRAGGTHLYPQAQFDVDAEPASPRAGLRAVLAAFAEVDPQGWDTASWLVSPQPELDGARPVDVLATRAVEVARLAGQHVARLAA